MRSTILTLSATLAALGYLTWYAGLAMPTEFFAPSIAQRLILVGLGICLVLPWIVTLMALAGESIWEDPFLRRQRLARRVLAALGSLPFVAHSVVSDVLTETLDRQVAFRLAVVGLALFAAGASLYFLDLAYVLRRVCSGVSLADALPDETSTENTT